MLVLSKIIYFFLHPLIWLIITLFLWAFSKKNKIVKWARICTFGIIIIFSNSVLFNEMLRMWEVHTIKKEDIELHDVGIVLGGMSHFDRDSERLSMGRSGDRIWQAMDLYYSKKIKKIALIGKNGEILVDWMDESVLMKEKLIEFGIPEEDIIVERESKNTHQNAEFTANLFKKEYPEFKSFLLITSASHIRRAKGCFEKQGMMVSVFPTNQSTSIKRRYNWHHFIIPSGETFFGWFFLNKEIFGYLSYRILGYL